jgi:hypothetical protein
VQQPILPSKVNYWIDDFIAIHSLMRFIVVQQNWRNCRTRSAKCWWNTKRWNSNRRMTSSSRNCGNGRSSWSPASRNWKMISLCNWKIRRKSFYSSLPPTGNALSYVVDGSFCHPTHFKNQFFFSPYLVSNIFCWLNLI